MKSLSNVFDCVSVCVIVCICVCMCVSNLFNGFGERENKIELARGYLCVLCFQLKLIVRIQDGKLKMISIIHQFPKLIEDRMWRSPAK